MRFFPPNALSQLDQSSAATFDSIQWDGTSWVARDIQSSTNRIVMKTEFNALGEFTNIQSGLGALSTLLTAGYAFDGRVGFYTSTTGTTALGVAGHGTALTDQIVLGTYNTDVCDIVRLPALSTALARFAVDCGLTDNRTGGATAPVDGVFFQYSDNVNSGKWLCCCMNNNTLTSTDSGIAVAINTWYRLEIEISTTQALFYIDGTLVATVGGIPTGTSRTMGKSALIRKSVGTVASTLISDYTHFIQGTAR